MKAGAGVAHLCDPNQEMHMMSAHPAATPALLTLSGYYDVALRDFGLMLGALTLTRLAWAYDPPLRRR